MKRLRAELWDKMHYMFRDYNDRMVHVSLTYDTPIDIEALKSALIIMVEKIPVLHSSFKGNLLRPYWKVNDYTIDDVFSVYDSDASEEFLMQYLPPESKVQIQVAVFGGCTLCIVENHMCMDGGDLKEFLAELMEEYNSIVGTGHAPISVREGSRAFEEVYQDLSPSDARRAKALYSNPSPKDTHALPLTPASDSDKSFIVKHKFDAATTAALKAAGKAHFATVNDVLTAAYLQAAYEIGDYDSSDSISVSCAMDLRKRHMKSLNGRGFTNHTAFMGCAIPRKGSNILETLEFVKYAQTTNKRDKYIGLYGLPLLKFAYSVMPYALAEKIIKIGYNNPLLAMSNIGVLDSAALSISGHAPIDGFMTGAVKYKPFSLLSATTLNGEMTIAICERGNDVDRAIIETFISLIAMHVDEIIDLTNRAAA